MLNIFNLMLSRCLRYQYSSTWKAIEMDVHFYDFIYTKLSTFTYVQLAVSWNNQIPLWGMWNHCSTEWIKGSQWKWPCLNISLWWYYAHQISYCYQDHCYRKSPRLVFFFSCFHSYDQAKNSFLHWNSF